MERGRGTEAEGLRQRKGQRDRAIIEAERHKRRKGQRDQPVTDGKKQGQRQKRKMRQRD